MQDFRDVLAKIPVTKLEYTQKVCKYCSGYKWVLDSSNKLIECEHCLDRNSRIRKLLEKAELPEYFFGMTFDTFEGDKKALEKAKNYVSKGGNNSIILRGGLGLGKTVLARCILAMRIKNELKSGLFITELDLLSKSNPTMEGEPYLDRVKRVELLVIDDIGTGNTSDFVKKQYLSIIKFRHDHFMPTIYTTNLVASEQLSNHIGLRASVLLAESCKYYNILVTGEVLRTYGNLENNNRT